MNELMRDAIQSMIACEPAGRNGRVSRLASGLALVQMDDAGCGEFESVVTDREADTLVAHGFRDERK